MTPPLTQPTPPARRLNWLGPLGVVAAWIVLQAWVLPRAGVRT